MLFFDIDIAKNINRQAFSYLFQSYQMFGLDLSPGHEKILDKTCFSPSHALNQPLLLELLLCTPKGSW